MPDVKKVIDGLKCCIVWDPDDRTRCPECPYRDPTSFCLNRLKHDALEVIEALSAALDALTSEDCEDCMIDPKQEGEADG